MSFEAILNYSFNGFKAGCHEVGICSKIEVRISKGGDSRSKAWQVRFRTKLIESLRFESEYELSEILFQVRVWSWELFEVRNAGSELFEVLSSRISIKIESVFWNWRPVWNIRLFELWSFRIGEAWESWLKIAGRLKLKYLVKLFKPREREPLVKTSLKFLCWVDFCLKFTVGRDLLGERRFKIESPSLKFKDWSLKTRDWKACFKVCWEMQDCWIKLFWSFKVASKVQIRNFW